MWDKLTLLKKLGEGGMGEVWLAYHEDLAAQFAVKKLRPDLVRPKDVQRFDRELRYLAAIRHPNIVRVVDFSSDPTRPGYAMEYCPDGSLADPAHAAIGEAQQIERFWQALEGLEHLHTRPSRLVHRDLKPGNLLMGADGKVKISDFGLSRDLDTSRVTSTASNWVSPGFSPPEQWEDFRSVDERSDLFALGATFYFLITSRHFNTQEGFDGVKSQSFRTLLERLLAIDRRHRIATTADVRKCWKTLTTSLTALEYLGLTREDRIAKLAVVADVHCGMNGGNDLIPCSEALSFLEEVLPIEPDADVRAVAEEHRIRVDREMRRIVGEMEQDNPSN